MDYISSMFTFGKRLLEAVPEVDGAFAYGSGVFFQPDLYTHMNQPQVDFVFIVSDPLQWHSQVRMNCRNCHFKSELGSQSEPLLGIGTLRSKNGKTMKQTCEVGCNYQVMTMSTGIGVGIHFNPFIIFENRVISRCRPFFYAF